MSDIEKDAARYRWLKSTLESAVGGGIEVNLQALVYEEPDASRRVRVFFYPNTPVGFNEAVGDTFDEAVDNAMRGRYA